MHKAIQLKTRIILSITLILSSATIYNICKIPTVTNAESQSSSYGLVATSESSLEISLVTPETPLSIKPTGGDGTFNSERIIVKVGTNNATGYKLTMSAATSSLSRSAAVNGETPTIPTLESATTETNFPVNHWGFMRTQDNGTFQPMTANEQIYINATGSQNDITESSAINDITFGVKLNNSVPMGDYNINLNFTATTNPVPMTMQDATASILAEYMPNIGDTYILRDSRDGKDYKIARLTSNQYWMAENLAFVGTTLTPQDSDVTANRNITWYDSVMDGTSEDGRCNGNNAYNNACSTTHAAYGGRYYNFFAATAGTISGVDNVEAVTDTICPSGWTIPSMSEIRTMYQTVGDSNGGYYFTGYGGYYNNGILTTAGNAFYWSKDARDSTSRHALLFSSAWLFIDTSHGRTGSIFLHCIFSGE